LGHYFYENKLLGDDLVVVAPDHSSVGRARKFAKLLHAEWAVVDRRVDNSVPDKAYAVTGNVAGKRAILIDDIIDTGSSMVLASEALLAAGVTQMYAVAPHAVFSDHAVEKLEKSAIQQVLVTNTIEVPAAKQFSKLLQVSVASTFAETIRRVNSFESIEDLIKSPDNVDVML